MRRIFCLLLTLLLLPAALAEESYDDLGAYGESAMWPVMQNGLWGFVDGTGELIIPCEWEDLKYAMVVDGYAPVCRDGQWGIIRRDGTLAVPCVWDMTRVEVDGGFTMWKNGYAGAMAEDGTVLIPCDTYTWVGPAIDGVRHVIRDGLLGMCDEDGDLITPCQWDDGGYFQEGLAFVQSEAGYGYINMQGEVAIACQYALASDFHQGSAAVKLPGFGGYQLIDRTGTALSGPWTGMELYSDNALLLVEQDGKFGYIDRQGNIAIPLVYDNAQSFGDGLALVRQGEASFWIDETGAKVLDRPEGYRSSPFRDGLAALRDESDLCGLMDKQGNLVIPCEWESWFNYAFGEDDITPAQRDGQIGFLNRAGELISGQTYPVSETIYGLDGDRLFLLREGKLSVWSAEGAQLK